MSWVSILAPFGSFNKKNPCQHCLSIVVLPRINQLVVPDSIQLHVVRVQDRALASCLLELQSSLRRMQQA